MPFVDQAHRDAPDMMFPGDRCYREYKHIMDEWQKSKRWGTVDQLAERLFPDDYDRAYFLAFLVFFAKQAMPYEESRIKLNGDITGGSR